MEREEIIKLIMGHIYTRRIYAEALADDILRLFSIVERNEQLKFGDDSVWDEEEKTKDNALLDNVDFQNQLCELGFKKLGNGWFANELDDIRIRLWKDCKVDFWLWRSSENTDDNQIHFRGEVFSIEDVKWVLEHCFNVANVFI